jgi:hypothetical protein
MGNGRHSGLPKGIKNVTAEFRDRVKDLVVHARDRGYRLKTGGIDTDQRATAMDTYLSTLDQFVVAMGLPDLSQSVIGSLEVHRFTQYGILGDASPDGDIRMSYDKFTDASVMMDTLPHEYTHQLVNYLITKEMGYAKGSPEYGSAYFNGDMYRAINTAALQKWRDWMRAEGNVDVANQVDTPFKAATYSGMRSYAIKEYPFARGAGIEIPTVAAENFVAAKFNWDTLKRNNSYSWFVLKEIQALINKK